MNILFIYPAIDISYPLQLGALSAYLKQSGHQTKLLHLVITAGLTDSHFKQVDKSINDFRPDYIGFSGYETAFNWIESLSKHIKKHHHHHRRKSQHRRPPRRLWLLFESISAKVGE